MLEVTQEVSEEVTIRSTNIAYDASHEYVITDISQPTSEYGSNSTHCDDGIYSKTVSKASLCDTTNPPFCPLTPE